MTHKQDIYPHLHLLVSGGNTQIILFKSWMDWEIIGKTLDDAAGECFDKAGRMLGLPYPGGIYLSKIAGLTKSNSLNFPISMKNSNNYNLSYSGLKTAVKYYLEKQSSEGKTFKLEDPLNKEEISILVENTLEDEIISQNFKLKTIKEVSICCQYVIVESLLNKISIANRNFNPTTVGLSGGVSANPLLRAEFEKHFKNKLLIAPKNLTGDNAVMIALAGNLDYEHKN